MVGLLAALALPASARADVELDPATDTVRVAGRLDGALTGPARGAAAPIGLRWVREHRASLGLTLADLETLGEPTAREDGGIRQVRWRQAVDGIEVADAELRVNVADDGRVINVLGSPASDLPTDTTPRLAKPDASAELTIYGGRLAYRYVDEVAADAIYDTISDADTGKTLKRTNLVKSADIKVWDDHPSLVRAPTVFTVPATWLTSTSTLESPYMHVYADLDGGIRNVEARVYEFAATGGIGCSDPKPCSWNGVSQTTASADRNAVQAFYLANRFREHLTAAPIGFEGFQDKLVVETSDADVFNNANMFTPPRGQRPRMQLGLWSGAGHRSVNSGDDASILFHEYTHGLSGRLVVDADGVQALGSWQAGAMGEGWSDFYAKDYLVFHGYETDSAATGEIDMGVYMDATPHSMRHAGLDCPVGSACPGGGYTYGDFGDIAGGPEFHADGEIWAQTLWDLRTALNDRDVTLAIVTRAMRLSPPEPSFLDMRNAILQADTALFSEAHHATIWAVFAKRGMGFYASTVDGADTNPVEDTSLPPAGAGGVLTGTVTDDGAPVEGATVTLGPRTAKTGPDGTYSLADLPARTYEHAVVSAPGYDRMLLDDVVVPGTADAALRRNWASVRKGATVTSTAGSENAPIGCGPKQAVDDLPGSTWSTEQTFDKPMVVRLPQAIDITGLGIDPTAGCGDLGGSSMGQYTVDVGPTETGPWTQVAGGVFGAVHRHQLNPVNATASAVEYVRITPMTTQLPGEDYIDLSEFAVYGTPTFAARIVSGPTAPVTAATFTFAGYGTAEFECRVDAEAFAPCTSPATYTRPDGPHRFEVRGVNGGARTEPVARDFTVDRTPPVLTISGVDVRDRSATFTFGAADASAVTYTCQLSDTTVPCASTITYSALSDGAYRFSVIATDAAGNRASAERSFAIEATPPDTVITWGPPPILTTRDFALAFTASEAATFACSIDGGAAVPCSSPLSLVGLSEGPHSVVVTATDAAGNVDPTPARSDFTVIIPGLPPAPSPTPTATPTVTPKRAALTSATVPKRVSRRSGKVKVTLRGVRGAKVVVQAKLGSRVVGKSTRTLRGSRLSFRLTLNKQRLRSGATVTVRVRATGRGLTPVTRTLRFRLKG